MRPDVELYGITHSARYSTIERLISDERRNASFRTRNDSSCGDNDNGSCVGGTAVFRLTDNDTPIVAKRCVTT